MPGEPKSSSGRPEEVVALGALCEVVTGGEPGYVGSLSFSVAEFADLADGSRLTLHNERGFTSGVMTSGRGRYRGDPWRFHTAESIRSGVLSTVLPDNDEEDPEQHPWAWLAELIGRHGITVDAESLKNVPYQVEFGERLLQRLNSAAP